jgi:carbonic anhydrase
MNKKYKAMVLSCIDPRFQRKVFNYLKKKRLSDKYSAFTIAGGAIGVTHAHFKKWHRTFIENLSTSIKLHKINRLIVINHKDCGAAKIINGKKDFNEINESEIHKKSFIKLKKILQKKYSKLRLEFYLMSQNSSVRKF